MSHRPRLRILLLAFAAAAVAAAFAAVGGATTSASPPVNTASPTVSGTATTGNTLTTTSGSWSGATPITFAYAWQRCDSAGNNCSTIASQSAATYTVAANDVGHRLRSLVTATNADGHATAASAPTALVAGPSAPASTAAPKVTGSATVGSTLSTDNGAWSGATPIAYAYDWRRCDTSGNNCASISQHSDNQSYVLVAADAGHTLRVVVTATNSIGQSQATSGASAVVSAGGPVNTGAPSISGTPAQGQTLTVNPGTWTSSSTVSYAYEWDRCDGSGNNCAAISGATSATYAVSSDDGGHTIRAQVTATNSGGSTKAATPAIGPVASGQQLPPGAVKLPDGEISIPASSVPDSDRLTITSIKYSNGGIHGRGPVSATVKVIDNNKYVIRDALVYLLPAPRSYGTHPAEQPTGQNGTAILSFALTSSAPHRGSLLLFIRARTAQGNLLAGSSTRRLVQVRIFPS